MFADICADPVMLRVSCRSVTSDSLSLPDV